MEPDNRLKPPRPDLPMNEEFVKLLRRILKAGSIVNPVHEMDLRKALNEAERRGSLPSGKSIVAK